MTPAAGSRGDSKRKLAGSPPIAGGVQAKILEHRYCDSNGPSRPLRISAHCRSRLVGTHVTPQYTYRTRTFLQKRQPTSSCLSK